MKVRYWWVNQNQTFRQEIDGGYLWSPKRNKNGHRNPFYEFMREVAPGDIVFSFCNTRISAIGIVSGYCRESPKPEEFGTAGTNWSQIGWRVGVRWQRLANAIRPKDHIAQLRSELTTRYSPLTPDGNGLQSVYLTRVGAGLASALFRLIGNEVTKVSDVGYEVSRIERDSPAPEGDIEEWERRVEDAIATDEAIRETERLALVQARRGQGVFRDNVRSIERACRITKVERVEHLIASHVQPWRDCSNEQRLDGENGLLLTPTVDHLFDKGFISFENSGQLIVSPVADQCIVQKGMAGSKELTREEFVQWTLICRSLFITVEDSFMQRKAGLLDDVAFHSFEAGTSTFFSSPGLRASWQLASGQYGKETRQFIDSMIKRSPAAGPTDAYSDWVRLLQTQETA